MRLVALIATLALPTVDAHAQIVAGVHRCTNAGASQVRATGSKSGIHKLGEMPPAKQILTVLREIDGCSQPVVLRQGIGAPQR